VCEGWSPLRAHCVTILGFQRESGSFGRAWGLQVEALQADAPGLGLPWPLSLRNATRNGAAAADPAKKTQDGNPRGTQRFTVLVVSDRAPHA